MKRLIQRLRNLWRLSKLDHVSDKEIVVVNKEVQAQIIKKTIDPLDEILNEYN